MYRFAAGGAAIGFLAGVLEAGLLFTIPRAGGLLHPDVRYVIWFLAPLLDLCAGALGGFLLGLLAGALGNSGLPRGLVAAFGLGLAAGYAAWMLQWFRVIFPRGFAPPAICFGIIFVASLILFSLRPRGAPLFFNLVRGAVWRRLGFAELVITGVLGLSIFAYALHHPPAIVAAGAPGILTQAPRASRRPNIVLIVLDTVRADHLSCYGYSRLTTPTIDRFASQGVLFDNVIAPSSWTLPSIASIFTGLMPHQHGANWRSALDASPRTLASILRSSGYETAGFNANPFYGLGGWRLSEGFDIYDDDTYAIRHNLAVTFLGQSALRFLYNRLIRYNQFDHRDAADVNRDIIRWSRSRDESRPFFLFVNYMDAHRPYLPPSPWDHRFGGIPHRLLARITAPLAGGRPRKPYTAIERQEMIDGYDNSLAYLDSQVGRLVRFLSASEGADDTVFIITSDHGEGFGEHGAYDHGWNLYSEVLRVPLVIWGTGIPEGVRVADLVPARRLFSTVLDLALGLKGGIAQTSLRAYWDRNLAPPPAAGEAVSELATYGPAGDPASLSLATPRWHLIWNSGGGVQLYDARSDPEEKNNLAPRPEFQRTLQGLKVSLEARIAQSLLPWRDLSYLAPLDRPGASFIEQAARHNLRLPSEGIPAGAAQSIFSHQKPSQLLRPSQAEQDLLRSLPYH
ncbi:MAG: sulfatase [Terriglobia bacterium]